MRKLHILGLALFAVFAFGALSAVSAFAAEEGEMLWLLNGSESLVGEKAVETTGEINLIDSTGAEILCSGIFDGTVEPGTMNDLITEILTLEKTALPLVSFLGGTALGSITCVFTKPGLCTGAVGGLIWVMPINLPWKTLLELISGSTVDQFTEGTGGLPGYEITCNTFLGEVTVSCTGKPGATVTNGANGTVNGSFSTTTELNPNGSCSDGGTAQVHSTSTGVTKLVEAGSLEVS